MEFYSTAQESPVAQGVLIIKASPSHSYTSHSVCRLWKNDQLDADNSI